MWTTLISTHELANHLHDADLRVIDVRHKLSDPSWGPSQYAQGHIPGAVHAHIDRDLSATPSPTTGRHPLPDPDAFRATCGRLGIDDRVQVVVYDDQGGVWAARLWWLLQHYGHPRVALLDGGWSAWSAEHRPVETVAPDVRPRTFPGTPGHRPTLEAAPLQASLALASFRLLDARAPERFRGEKEPVDPVAGHIPGARSLPALSLVDAQQRFPSSDELRRRLQPQLSPDGAERTVAYCGSGVTACHLVLAFEAAGLGPIRLYPGSWSEWIRDPSRPIERGAGQAPSKGV